VGKEMGCMGMYNFPIFPSFLTEQNGVWGVWLCHYPNPIQNNCGGALDGI